VEAIPMQTLGPDTLAPLADIVRGFRAAASIEEAAAGVCRALYENLVDADSGTPACALVRVYKAHQFGKLEPELQEFARGLLEEEPPADMRCLTLLGTAGDEPAWNSRHESAGHKAIPLPGEEFVHRLPMVAQLIKQLGLDIADVVRPGENAVARSQQTYDVFHVEDALGSGHIPAQDFVEQYGIRSAVGFGGVLISGDFYAAIMFSKVPVPERIAKTLKILALPLRLALNPSLRRPAFAAVSAR
jgi:hypothetical protein